MKEYHKIQTVFLRSPESNFKDLMEGEWTLPEYELLKDIEWVWTEKIDGCLHYTQEIITDKGYIKIGRIVNEQLQVKVLSYNIETGVVEYKNILHYHKEPLVRPFISVSVKSRMKGNRPKHIVCTDNHNFFSNGKWIQAKNLKSRDIVSHLAEILPNSIKQMILGGLLGDSSIYRPSETTRGFSLSHSVAQSEYFEWKKTLFGKLFRECKSSIGGFSGSLKNRRGGSIISPSISDLIKRFCEIDNKKKITKKWADELQPFGLAIWYMDDGSTNINEKQRPRVRFSTNGFSRSEVEVLRDMLQIRFGIDCDIFDYKGNTLVLSADGSEKLFDLIFPYICESMKYKLPNNYKNYQCVYTKEIPISNGIIETEVIHVGYELPVRSKNQQQYQYDLTIADNSNYFTSSVLVHNTNIRVIWDGQTVRFGGKTDDAQISTFLLRTLQDTFTKEKMKTAFPDINFNNLPSNVCLYGEGYGAKIQKGGNYLPDSTNFILFDCLIDNWWLKRESLEDIATKLSIPIVPIIGTGTLLQAVEYCKTGFKSVIAENKNYSAEGLVMKPKIELFNRKGEIIITKIKFKDFKK